MFMRDINFIYIDGWKSKVRFSAAHLISDYERCGRLHGHTYAVHMKIYGRLGENGILIDFTVLKQLLNKIVDELDHKMLIPGRNPNVSIDKDNDSVSLISLDKHYIFPISDCIILPIETTSAENLSNYILEKIYDNLLEYNNIYEIEIGVDEGYGQGAWVRKIIRDEKDE